MRRTKISRQNEILIVFPRRGRAMPHPWSSAAGRNLKVSMSPERSANGVNPYRRAGFVLTGAATSGTARLAGRCGTQGHVFRCSQMVRGPREVRGAGRSFARRWRRRALRRMRRNSSGTGRQGTNGRTRAARCFRFNWDSALEGCKGPPARGPGWGSRSRRGSACFMSFDFKIISKSFLSRIEPAPPAPSRGPVSARAAPALRPGRGRRRAARSRG